MSYGKWLKEAREAKKMTQEQLAEKITLRGHKVTGGNVSNIEREYDRDKEDNPVRPSKWFVIYSAEILEKDVDEALMLADYAPKNKNLLPKEFEEFKFSEFNKETIKEIAEFIRFKTFNFSSEQPQTDEPNPKQASATIERPPPEKRLREGDITKVAEKKGKVTNGR